MQPLNQERPTSISCIPTESQHHPAGQPNSGQESGSGGAFVPPIIMGSLAETTTSVEDESSSNPWDDVPDQLILR